MRPKTGRASYVAISDRLPAVDAGRGRQLPAEAEPAGMLVEAYSPTAEQRNNTTYTAEAKSDVRTRQGGQAYLAGCTGWLGPASINNRRLPCRLPDSPLCTRPAASATSPPSALPVAQAAILGGWTGDGSISYSNSCPA